MLFSALSTPCSAFENSLSILRPHVSIWKWGPYLFCAHSKERGGTLGMHLPPLAALVVSEGEQAGEMGRMKSHEASLGKLQRCLRLPRKLKLQWKEGKWSFPSTLEQRSSSPQITQNKLELPEHVFILVTQPRRFLGHQYTDVHWLS